MQGDRCRGSRNNRIVWEVQRRCTVVRLLAN